MVAQSVENTGGGWWLAVGWWGLVGGGWLVAELVVGIRRSLLQDDTLRKNCIASWWLAELVVGIRRSLLQDDTLRKNCIASMLNTC